MEPVKERHSGLITCWGLLRLATDNMASNHCWYQLLLIFINLAAIVGTILVILTDLGLHYGFQEPIPELLENGTVEIDKAFQTPISPRPWLHATWLVVYAWMLAWSVHSVVSVCRTVGGVPVYVNPSLVNTPILLFSIGACCCTVAWYCVYDREYISTATLFSLCVTCLSWSAYILSLYSLHVGMYRLEKIEQMKEAWLHRLLVQNGLALLGMWSFFVTTLNLCTALIHNKDIRMDEDTAALISLSIMAFYLTLHVIVDVTVMDRYGRYTCIQYLVPIVVVCAIIFRQDSWESDDVTFILLATLVAFSFLEIMLKAACVACRIMTSSPRDSPHGDVTGTGQEGPYMVSPLPSTGYYHAYDGHYK